MTATPRAEPAARRLIINADDFALTPAVTAGILEAHAAGSVTSTSMMVRCPGWDDGVRQAKAATSLGVGLHFNLLLGAPLAPVPSLMDQRSGRYVPLATLILRSLRGAIDRDDVSAECEAQLAALREAGIQVTHIDSHRHVHALPGIRAAVTAVAARHGLAVRRPVESARWFPLDPVAQARKAMVAAAWISSAAPPHRHTDHFVGLSLQGRADFGARLARVLERLPRGSTELMVHPGRVDDALRAVDPANTVQRERELEALLSPALRERLRHAGLTLIGFGAV